MEPQRLQSIILKEVEKTAIKLRLIEGNGFVATDGWTETMIQSN